MADFRLIPSIDELRQRGAIRALETRFGANATVDALRAAAASVRDAIAAGDASLGTDTNVVARVEMGGGFRVPDVMAQSGAVLREVGTTNKTRAADYAAAIGNRTALILRVHPSNFRIEGFTERPDVGDLVAIGRRFNVPVAEDLGSGDLGADGGQMGVRPRSETATWSEPAVGTSINAGVDTCCFS